MDAHGWEVDVADSHFFSLSVEFADVPGPRIAVPQGSIAARHTVHLFGFGDAEDIVDPTVLWIHAQHGSRRRIRHPESPVSSRPDVKPAPGSGKRASV